MALTLLVAAQLLLGDLQRLEDGQGLLPGFLDELVAAGPAQGLARSRSASA